MIPAWYLGTIGFPSFISQSHQCRQMDDRTTHIGKWQTLGVCPLDCCGAELFRPWLPSLALFIQRNSLSFNATNTPEPGGSGSQRPVTHLVELCRHFQNRFYHHLPWPSSIRDESMSEPVSVFLNRCTLKLQNTVLSGPLNSGSDAISNPPPQSGTLLEFSSHTLISVKSSRHGGWLCCQLELQAMLMVCEGPKASNRNTEARCQDSNTGALSFNF